MAGSRVSSSATPASARPDADAWPDGWRNRDDGAVEAVFEGDQSAVDAMVAWARTGPRSATVAETEVHEEAPEGMVGFRIR